METRSFLKAMITTITIILLIPIIYTLINPEALSQTASTQIQTYGIPALFITSLILDLIPQLLSPAVILAAGILAGIPTVKAIAITILGSTIGSLIGFVIGKKYMFKAVDILITKESIQRLTHLTNKYGKIIVPLAAVSPLPYLPVLFGAMNFTKRNFIVYGLIPRAIGITVYGYLAHLL